MTRVFTVALIIALPALGFSRTFETLERVYLGQVARAFARYKHEHDGKLPRDWEELSLYFDLEAANKAIIRRGGHPFQTRYKILERPIAHDLGQLLVVRLIPSYAEGEPECRYTLVEMPRGEITTLVVPEPEIQVLLAKANVVLPTVTDGAKFDREPRPRPYGEPNPNLDEANSDPNRASVATEPVRPNNILSVPITQGSYLAAKQRILIGSVILLVGSAIFILFRRKQRASAKR